MKSRTFARRFAVDGTFLQIGAFITGEFALGDSELGFQVEIWDWTRHDIDALVETGATFSSMTGYVAGTLADDAGADELLARPSSQSRSQRNSTLLD